MGKCKKCNKTIPSTYLSKSGKMHKIQDRKFCLECSPFMGRNTRSDDPSVVPQNKNKYANWPDKLRRIHQARTALFGVKIRERLVSMFGGKCVKCGYDKCIRNMHFHHRDPSTKLFELSSTSVRTNNFDVLVEEAKKCDLLCSNCHGEEEDKVAKSKYLDRNSDLVDGKTFKRWSDLLAYVGRSSRGPKRELLTKQCQWCRIGFKTKTPDRIYCCFKCSVMKKKTPIPPKSELKKLRDNGATWKEIGEKYKVRPNLARKWGVQLGLASSERNRNKGMTP